MNGSKGVKVEEVVVVVVVVVEGEGDGEGDGDGDFDGEGEGEGAVFAYNFVFLPLSYSLAERDAKIFAVTAERAKHSTRSVVETFVIFYLLSKMPIKIIKLNSQHSLYFP